ncbi:MAG: hypothetical protein M1814_004472 [Vezdaea aestivalis]|nr:MAG: hypothetical protein M1814_004472 [Vezdaea aestivalis]
MSTEDGPSTPELKTLYRPMGTIRRSTTLPAKLNENLNPDQPTSPASKADITTLFTHTDVRVIKFRPLRHMSAAQRSSPIEPDSLPWASRPETVLAYGNIRLYVAPHSIAFLNAGSLNYPIMSRTQCWCVDGESKFAMPTQDSSYYRIELPTTSNEDKSKIEEFKIALANILRYEKTACPFKRGFTVDLPPEPETPIKQVPWKPKASLLKAEMASELEDKKFETKWQRNSIPISQKSSDESFSNVFEGKEPLSTEKNSGVDKKLELEPSKGGYMVPKANQVSEIVGSLEKVILRSDRRSLEDILQATEDTQNDEDHTSSTPNFPEARSANEVPIERPAAPRIKSVDQADPFIVSERRGASELSPAKVAEEILEVDSSDEYMTARSHSSSFSTLEEDLGSDATDDTNATLKEMEDKFKTPTKPKSFLRSATMSSIIDRASSFYSQHHKSATLEPNSVASSVESFQSFHSPMSPLPPSPPDSDRGSPESEMPGVHLQVGRQRVHKRDESGITITANSPGLWDLRTPSDDEVSKHKKTESSTSIDSVVSPSETIPKQCKSSSAVQVQKGRRLRQQRSLSPLPPAANIVQSRPYTSDRHITATIIQTTWAILNSPPSHLVQLMLTVARRIASGALSGSFASQSDSGDPVTCTWDYTDGVHIEATDLGEDDYGVPITSPRRRRTERKAPGDDFDQWEVD